MVTKKEKNKKKESMCQMGLERCELNIYYVHTHISKQINGTGNIIV